MIETIAISAAYQGIKLAVEHADDAVATVKKMMAVGHDILDCTHELRTFFVSQGKAYAEEAKIEKAKQETPEAFADVDPTAMALDIVFARRKLEQREKEIREWLIYSGNGDVYREMCVERAKIIGNRKAIEEAEKKVAERAAQERKRRRKKIYAIVENTIVILFGFSAMLGLSYGFWWLLQQKGSL